MPFLLAYSSKETKMYTLLKRVLCMGGIFVCAMQAVRADVCEPIDTAEVLQAEQLRLASQMQNNLDTMSKLLDDKLVYVRNSGVVDTKLSYIDSMRKGDTVYENIEHSNDAVRVYGCVAILTGKGKYDVLIGQKPLKLMLRYHSIWQKSHGQVRLVSWQATRLP
jgi:hypothetical protein